MAGSLSDSEDGEVGWGSFALDEEPRSPSNQDEAEVGWDIVSAQQATPSHAGSSAASPPSSANPWSKPKRRPGRPPGIRGSHAYRRELREQLEADRSAPKPAVSVSERCARARQAKAEKRLQSQSVALPLDSVDSRPASDSLVLVPQGQVKRSFGPGSDQALVQKTWKEDMFWVAKSFLAAALAQNEHDESRSGFQVKVYIDSMFASTGPGLLAGVGPAEPVDAIEQGCEDLPGAIARFFEPYRGYCSVSQTAQEFKATDFSVSHNLIRSASALVNLSSTMRSGLIQQIIDMIDVTHSGVMVIAKFRFDERPSKIKVSDLDSSAMPGPYRQSGSSKFLAKILQTELEIAFLMTLDFS